MCNYKYILEPDKKCPYSDLFEQLANDPLINKKIKDLFPNQKHLDLPIDSNGICIFHSSDISFKKSNNSVERFRELVEILNSIINSKIIPEWEVMDFNEFLFVEELVKYTEDYETYILDLSELNFMHYCMFNGTTWKNRVLFDQCNFIKTVYFENANFEEGAEFKYSEFNMRVQLNSSNFNELSIVSSNINTLILSESNISSGRIIDCDIKTHFSAEGARINEFVFEKVKIISVPSNHYIDFKRSYLNDVVFIQTIFNGQTNFSECSFDQVEFTDTFFAKNYKLTLDHISVNNNLIFKSSNPHKKLFEHQVSLDASIEQIQGKIIFEQANVHFISPRRIFKELSRVGTDKIIVGDGCEKYKLKKEILLNRNETTFQFLEELARSFIEFYNWATNLNISINMECEYYDTQILVRYYSDQNITEDIFFIELEKHIPGYLEFLKAPADYLLKKSNTKNSNDKIETLDLYRHMLAAQIGLLARVQFDKNWSEKSLTKLLSILPQEASKLKIHIDKLEIHQHFQKQQSVLNFGNNYLSGNDMKISK